jgi:hypothetical protein
MSRSGYSEECDGWALIRWRGAVKQAISGARGQAMLRELVQALDAMEDKRLYPGSFRTADGEFCALGALAARRGTKVDDLGDEDYGCDKKQVGQRFGVAPAMVAEIMYLNDEYMAGREKIVAVEICGPMRPHWPDYGRHDRQVIVHNDAHSAERWQRMRAWAVEHLKTPNAANEGPAR